MGRRTKTLVPTMDALLEPKTIAPTLVQKELTQKRRQKQKQYFDQHTKPLAQLKAGDQILVSTKDGKWKPAKVTGRNKNGPDNGPTISSHLKGNVTGGTEKI